MNIQPSRIETLADELPSPGSALRFLEQFTERNPSHAAKILKNEGLLADLLTLASYSPILAATLVQNPEYVGWLSRRRADPSLRSKEELLESLARFSLTNSQLDPSVLFARFRRRELLRIFIRDVRRLTTIAEITEEISSLADAILENALRIARQEMDNRYGAPFEKNDKGKEQPSDLVIVSLGKLGSKELNYSSDIDLLFIYSGDGNTTGNGTKGSVTNREYFSKLSEAVIRLVGRSGGEGSAYRVDMRLRPHGRVGALALSLNETVRYYLTEARNWEQQVLIRSRASAGNDPIFREFFDRVEDAVFRPGRNVADALAEVFRSKEKIDLEQRSDVFDVKLGRGGIREIEFIAQALQLAYGGSDRWLRAPHTLISISRLADRAHITSEELSHLSAAYDFLRRLEHILQMEHGLQTHSLPREPERLEILAAKMRFADEHEFHAALFDHTERVSHVFRRVFGGEADAVARLTDADGDDPLKVNKTSAEPQTANPHDRIVKENAAPFPGLDPQQSSIFRRISQVSPKFEQMIVSMPRLASVLKPPDADLVTRDFAAAFTSAAHSDHDIASVLASMRKTWSESILEIAIAEIFENISIDESRRLQTRLAEASIGVAMQAAGRHSPDSRGKDAALPAVIALGKLGSGTLDYGSDLDIVAVSGEQSENGGVAENSEWIARIIERFVTLLSGMTREGNLYRVDLRLRPHGRNGPLGTSTVAFEEYIRNTATVWELLAYIQMRAIGDGTDSAAGRSEAALRLAIAERVGREDPSFIKSEAWNMRKRLEEAHGTPRSRHEANIKFGSGGLLDVYFAVRYLQLANITAVPADVRTTTGRLDALLRAGVLSAADHAAFSAGHAFLSTLDHTIRLVSGRSSRITMANRPMIDRYARRMSLDTAEALFEQLAFHRIAVREAFENVFLP